MTELGDKLRALSESSRTEYAKRRAAFNITCRQDELRFERKEADESGMMECCQTTRDELFDAYDAESTRLRDDLEREEGVRMDAQRQLRELRAELAAKDADVVRLEKAAKWEQYRSERIGTHSQDCWQWGPEHYVCALREIAAIKENSNGQPHC